MQGHMFAFSSAGGMFTIEVCWVWSMLQCGTDAVGGIWCMRPYVHEEDFVDMAPVAFLQSLVERSKSGEPVKISDWMLLFTPPFNLCFQLVKDQQWRNETENTENSY